MLTSFLQSRLIMPAAILVFALAPASSQAGVVFTTSSVDTSVNIGRFNKTGDFTAVGVALNDNSLPDNTPLLQVETDVALQIGASGQAFLETLNSSEAFGMITITPIDPPLAGFLVIEFNPEGDNPVPAGTTMTLAAFLNGSNTATTPDNGITQFTFGNGNNRVAAVVTGDDIITKLVVTIVPPNPESLKQFRISYQLSSDSQVVPEPSTLAMAFSAFGLMSLAGLRRLRRRL